MPQFNDYPAIVSLLAADLILVYEDDVGAVKTITAEDFAAAIKALTLRNLAVALVNSNTTLTSENEFVVGNSGSSFIITLPDAADNPGLSFYISNKGIGNITVDTTGSDTVIGEPSIILAQYKSYLFLSDGVDMWFVFGLPT